MKMLTLNLKSKLILILITNAVKSKPLFSNQNTGVEKVMCKTDKPCDGYIDCIRSLAWLSINLALGPPCEVGSGYVDSVNTRAPEFLLVR